jgi:hypothetical protein
MPAPLCTPPAVCSECGRPHFKPRERMPASHALETVQAILIRRLDDRLEAVANLVHEHLADHADVDACERLAIRLVQDLQLTFFRSAFEDGEAYQPDPAGRMGRLPEFIPRVPMLSVFARHLLQEERAKAAGQMKTTDGTPVFSDGELVRMKERREKREARQTAAV